MKSGSIIFDLAVAQGGNAAYSEVDKVVNKDGIKIMESEMLWINYRLLLQICMQKIYLVLLEIFTAEKKTICFKYGRWNNKEHFN